MSTELLWAPPLFFCYRVAGDSYIFWTLALPQLYGLQMLFSHSMGCVFILFLCRSFMVWCVPLVWFSLLLPVLLVTDSVSKWRGTGMFSWILTSALVLTQRLAASSPKARQQRSPFLFLPFTLRLWTSGKLFHLWALVFYKMEKIPERFVCEREAS